MLRPVLLRLISLCVLLSSALGFVACQANAQVAVSETWRRTDGSLMMALRSNAPHFWQWAADQGKAAFPAEAMGFVGIVAGDAHHENFSYVFAPGGKRVYVMNDMDDSGEAPFFLDFLKFLGVTLSATADESDLNTLTMFESYLAGVKGFSWTGRLPNMIEDDAEVTPAQLADDYLSKIKKNTSHGEFDKGEGMTLSKDFTSAQKHRFQDLETKWFANALPAGYEIKDRAIYTKEGGGSGGTDRYWYSLKKSDNDRQIIEFKPLEAPSVQYIQNTQPGGVDRLQLVTDVFWDDGVPAPYGIVGDSRVAFWMRPRYPSYISLDLKEIVKHQKNFAELSQYIAFRMGAWHGKQASASGYASYLASHQDEMIKAADVAVHSYLQLAELNQGKKAR